MTSLSARERRGGAWRDQAACLDFPPELFFPHATDYADEARAICSICPVRQQCLQEALDGDLRYGVWGGLTERQRARLVRTS